MVPPLAELEDCFEGVVPSIIATSSADGVPNISYLSHVDLVDDRHVALSNQFFGKTVDNLRANPSACLMLVDGATGQQYRLDVTWLRNEREGPLFRDMAASLRASSAQIGMAGVMRLDSVDLFRVEAVRALPVPDPPPAPARRRDWAGIAAEIGQDLARETEVAGLTAALLDGLTGKLGCPAAILFQYDPAGERLVTVASRGYPSSGAGSEVPLGEGIAGGAAAGRCVVKVSDMSRVARFGAAIRASSSEDIREIPLPRLPDANSQIAVPLIARGDLIGVIFAESPRRLAFGRRAAAALTLLAGQMAAASQLAERMAEEAPAPAEALPAPGAGPAFRVAHHRYDDSVFIDNAYVIKGVAGRLLVYLLRRHLEEGRVEFTNREIRLAPDLRLPDFRDNLETRLLLLRQRLEERGCPARLTRPGRGRIRLDLAGLPVIETHA
ncbi:pyridoxamine 5'-phosphate oxidase family protein [Amaricoccus solimangrovi]|uniref:Pyridoxamine 5'-phosphate oxidase family protein n=1 Tax=Amaricoccus solimangrovi TaxID=2589815 RepID=A0A501X0H9_9RHOB|nr:pyridoxamine 5'-phosphate oxidase family protein [Amaricoccus solimangrovi]